MRRGISPARRRNFKNTDEQISDQKGYFCKIIGFISFFFITCFSIVYSNKLRTMGSLNNQTMSQNNTDTTMLLTKLNNFFQRIRESGIVYYFMGGILVLVVTETITRKHIPESYFRPTNTMSLITNQSQIVFRWLGFQFARITDLVYYIREYFPYQDICNLLSSTWQMVKTPFQYFGTGWYDYFADMVSNYYKDWLEGTALDPMGYGVMSTGLAVATLSATAYYVFYVNENSYQNLLSKITIKWW